MPEAEAGQIAASAALTRYFEDVARAAGNPRTARTWVTGELTRALQRRREADRADAGSRRWISGG